MTRRKALTSLIATTLQDQTTGLGAHSLPETVGLGSTTIVWLKCSLHNFLLLTFNGRRKIRRLTTSMDDVKESGQESGQSGEESPTFAALFCLGHRMTRTGHNHGDGCKTGDAGESPTCREEPA